MTTKFMIVPRLVILIPLHVVQSTLQSISWKRVTHTDGGNAIHLGLGRLVQVTLDSGQNAGPLPICHSKANDTARNAALQPQAWCSLSGALFIAVTAS